MHTKASRVRFAPVVDFALGEILGYAVLPCTGTERCWTTQTDAVSARDAAYEDGLLVEHERRWRRDAIEGAVRAQLDPRTLLMIDVDPRVLDDDTFGPGFTRKLLEDAGLPVKSFVLRMQMPCPQQGRARLRTLARHYVSQGFPIAVHGVGGDAASLSLIQELDPDIIELDPALVRGVASDPLRWNLLSGFAEFCRTHNKRLIADGIDNLGDLAAATHAGLRYGRGFLLGRAAPTPEAIGTGTRGLLCRLTCRSATAEARSLIDLFDSNLGGDVA